MKEKKENNPQNYMELKIPAQSVNESFARSAVAAFAVQLNPTVEQINDIKTAVSEAVTNCIVHGYEKEGGEIIIKAKIESNALHIDVEDSGKGIDNIEQAMQPFFTTKPEQERSGMGFTVMQAFSDDLKVYNKEEGGLKVSMKKIFNTKNGGKNA